MEATSNNTYWPPTSDMEYQASNQNYMPQSGEITDPWSNHSQTPGFHNMDVSSPYISSSLSLGTTVPNFAGSPYPYPHFQTNSLENHPFPSQDTPVSPMVPAHNPSRPAPPLLQSPPSNLPHLIDPSQRVGLSEMWSLQGMRDMEAFERSCSNTNMLRMKPRPQRKVASTTTTTNEASSSSSTKTTNYPSSPMMEAENAGCSTHNAFPLVAMSDALGGHSDANVVKPEFTHPDQPVSYIPPKESSYQDTVLSNNFASAMSYPSASPFASPSAASMPSPVPDSVGPSPISASPISPTLPPMTVPSQSPIIPRSTLRHPNILPAPSKRSVPTLIIDLGLTPRQRRGPPKASLVGKRSSDASPRNELHSDTNILSSPDIAKSTIQNGPSPGPESSRPYGSTRSRRNPRPNPNRSNSIPASDASNVSEHKLTETHTIPAADLDKFFYLPEQGCIGGRKAWMCPKCKKFVRKQDRTSHKLGHEGKKRYDCRCGKQFGRPQDADRHIREQAPCRRCEGKMGRYGKDGFCSACVMEIEQQGNNGT